MEAQTTKEPEIMETRERLCIYQNEQEITRISQEADARATLLNKILDFGLLTNDKIKEVTASLTTINDFIFREQLKINKVLKKQFDAGKKNLMDEYELPQNLQSLKYALTAWLNYPKNYREGTKYQHIRFSNTWEVDSESLEKEFEMRSLKIYVQGEQLAELRKLQDFSEYLDKTAESGQIFSNTFLNQRYTCDHLQSCNLLPAGKFKVKYSYFRKR